MKRACSFPRASVAKTPSALGYNLRPLWGQQAIDEFWTVVSIPSGSPIGFGFGFMGEATSRTAQNLPDKYQALNCQVPEQEFLRPMP
jgi:hypothetical protein